VGIFITVIDTVVSIYRSICLECCFICPGHLRKPGMSLMNNQELLIKLHPSVLVINIACRKWGL